MKKILLTLALALCVSVVALGQQMSDQQVLQMITTEIQAGTPESQIPAKLMEKGVKMDQIRRVIEQYRDGSAQNGDVRTGTVGELPANEKEEGKDDGKAAQDVPDVQNAVADENGRVVYGRDIFSQANPSFQPNVNMAVPTSYVLGPGDQVVVDIYGASQLSLVHTISPEGSITVTGYGPVYLGGLTVAEAQKKLRSTLGSRYQSNNFRLTVSETRTIQVNIMGEVVAPGAYQLSAFANVFYALYQAGGTSSLGTLRNIRVYRDGRLVTVVDVYEFILNGRLAGDISLQDNDVILVGPYDCLVEVTGNVKRPMFYEMRKDESVADLIRYAGGFASDAHTGSVTLVRQAGGRYSVFTLDESEMATFRMEDGDAVTVEAMIERYQNMVQVEGAVFRPGMYQLGGDVTTVRSLIVAAEGLKEDALATHAIIRRLKEDRTREMISVDVQGILDGRVADIPLENEDVLTIASREEINQERTFTITGEVLNPDTYVFVDNTTIEDLIVLAGGLLDQASLARVDVSRRIWDPRSTGKSDEISQTYSFEIRDGLVIEGGSRFVLQPYDVVHVRKSPSFNDAMNFTVTGEVNYEGSFTLENKSMRLSDAIRMAGGVTSSAYLRGAWLERVMSDEERARQQATLDAVNNLITDRDSMAVTSLQLGDTYSVGIHLDEALKHPGGKHDILLRQDDKIVVPEYNGSVKISGNVLFPNTVSYINGESYRYYIEQAGGYGNRAKKNKVFIVYQNGSVGLASKGAKPEPGCEIVVPYKVARTPVSWTSIAGISSTLASLSTLVIAIMRLK